MEEINKGKAVNDYYLGLLVGDGYLQDDYYYFSTTSIELANLLESKLVEKKILYRRYTRPQLKEKWEQLEIFHIIDKEFLAWLEYRQIFSHYVADRFKCNSSFVRGYMETKGTFFYYQSRQNNDAWRIAISGRQEDLQYLHAYLLEVHGIKSSAITQRKEREDLNIISKSYRFAIQNRKGVADFIDWINSDYDITAFLKEKILAFHQWNASKPYNMVKRYKNYKSATLAMATKLNIEIKGIRGGGFGKNKPVYRWENNEIVQEFAGWEGAYSWTKEKFKNELGLNPPIVLT